VRLEGHLLLGIQTDMPRSNNIELEAMRRRAALERHMNNFGTADSFLNIMLRGLPARCAADFLPATQEVFIRFFRVWDNCANCKEETPSQANQVARRGAVNFLTQDACSASLQTAPTSVERNSITRENEVNIITVYENRNTVQHLKKHCSACQSELRESWVRNIPTQFPIPPFLILSFPDELVLPTAAHGPVMLYPEARTIVKINGQQIEYQLLHVIQYNATHYRDVGLEVSAPELRSFPAAPWILNDNKKYKVGVTTRAPVYAVNESGYRPVVAIYYCVV